MKNKQFSSIVHMFMIGLVITGSSLSYGQETSAKPAFVPGEVIVKMKPSASPRAMASSIFGVEEAGRTTSGGEVIIRISPTRANALATAQVEDETLALVDELNSRPGVLYAQPNYMLQAVRTPNDTRYSEQWSYFNNGTGNGESAGGVGLPAAWDKTTGSEDIVVAVIDTGILPNHEDIQGSPNLIPGFDMITNPFIGNDGDGRDADPTDPGDAISAGECGNGPPTDRDSSWHGTHVAGTVGVGNTDNNTGIAGINWKTKVQAVRVLGKCGGTTADIIDGIRWAAGLEVPGAATNPTPANIINMSLGAFGVNCPTQDQATQAAIRDAVQAGSTVIVAAGNDARDAAQATPASCDNVIAVAASGPQGHLVTRYSNFGDTIDILAPGGDVRAGAQGGVLSMVKDGYEFYNGTSMAAPTVAGVAALILSKNPELLPGQVEARLKHDALPRNDQQCPKPCGAGLLQARFESETTGKADMGVRIEVDQEQVNVGEGITYSVILTNNGPDEAKDVSLTNTLPGGVNLQSKEINHGSCSGETVITCKVDPMAPGAHARLTTIVTATTPGTITNHAEVKAAQEDTIMGNNVASATTIITGGGDGPMEIPVAPPANQGEIKEWRQKDLYKFVVVNNTTYTIETAGTTDVMMTLLGPDNQQTAIDQDLDSGEGLNAKIVAALTSGTYFVEIRHQSIFGTGPYEVSVR